MGHRSGWVSEPGDVNHDDRPVQWKWLHTRPFRYTLECDYLTWIGAGLGARLLGASAPSWVPADHVAIDGISQTTARPRGTVPVTVFP
jgi:hypothetical protein